MEAAVFKEMNRLLWVKGVGMGMKTPDLKEARMNKMGVNKYLQDLWTRGILTFSKGRHQLMKQFLANKFQSNEHPSVVSFSFISYIYLFS